MFPRIPLTGSVDQALARTPCRLSPRPLKLEPDRELSLSSRRVDVRRQRIGLAEQRPAVRVVRQGEAAGRRVEVHAIEHVEELHDEFRALRAADAQELREAN